MLQIRLDCYCENIKYALGNGEVGQVVACRESSWNMLTVRRSRIGDLFYQHIHLLSKAFTTFTAPNPRGISILISYYCYRIFDRRRRPFVADH